MTGVNTGKLIRWDKLKSDSWLLWSSSRRPWYRTYIYKE